MVNDGTNNPPVRGHKELLLLHWSRRDCPEWHRSILWNIDRSKQIIKSRDSLLSSSAGPFGRRLWTSRPHLQILRFCLPVSCPFTFDFCFLYFLFFCFHFPSPSVRSWNVPSLDVYSSPFGFSPPRNRQSGVCEIFASLPPDSLVPWRRRHSQPWQGALVLPYPSPWP
jgi:hypothetical protein